MRLFGRRWKWSHADVVDASYPKFAVRTYLEHQDLREYLRYVTGQRPIDQACELGCGYGRMTLVLREFCSDVVGFEREPEFVAEATALIPGVRFVNVASLSEIPQPDGSCDFAMTFTVLQHMTDADAAGAVAQLKRIVRPGGFILLCEESDPQHVPSKPPKPGRQFTIGRERTTYERLLEPCTLVKSSPRRIEPGYSRTNVGDYLLFRRP